MLVHCEVCVVCHFHWLVPSQYHRIKLRYRWQNPAELVLWIASHCLSLDLPLVLRSHLLPREFLELWNHVTTLLFVSSCCFHTQILLKILQLCEWDNPITLRWNTPNRNPGRMYGICSFWRPSHGSIWVGVAENPILRIPTEPWFLGECLMWTLGIQG